MLIRKQYLKRLRPFYQSEMIKVLYGVRRCGKSTLMRQIISDLQERNVDSEQIIYINFSDYSYQSISYPDKLHEFITNKIITNKKYYLLIDEIQNVNDFELVINSINETYNVSIFITGASSRLLSGELATHLGGRTINFHVMPFSFSEYCQYKKLYKHFTSYREHFDEYMHWGGFPLIASSKSIESKLSILSSIYDSALLQDILLRHKISSSQALEKLVEYTIANSALTFSGNVITSHLSQRGIKVSSPTVYEYIKHVTESCICDKISRYDITNHKLLTYDEKTYVCDTGLLYLKSQIIELNRLFEIICYNELISRGYDIHIGKTYKGIITFIAEKPKEKIYLLVTNTLCANANQYFEIFNAVHDHYPKLVISNDTIDYSRDGIIHKNIIEFLLNPKIY